MRLFEFGDFDWVPGIYHYYLRRVLTQSYKVFGYHPLWAQALSDFIASEHSDKFIECGAGDGSVLPMIVKDLPDSVTEGVMFYQSDLRPIKMKDREKTFNYVDYSVDATRLPSELSYPKIFINSFHHFSPSLAKEIINDSLGRDQSVLILEYMKNSPLLRFVPIIGFLSYFILVLTVVRFKDIPIVLLFTFVIPIFPLMFAWDGLASLMRVYKKEKLEELLGECIKEVGIVEYNLPSPLATSGCTAMIVSPRRKG